MIRFIVAISFLTLFVEKLAAQSGYFPLAVGNRWLYECTYTVYDPTYEHDEPVCKVFVDSTGHRSGDTGLQELAITDTVRIALDSPQRGTWITETWPDALDGTLYYLLEGEVIKKIGLRPPPIKEYQHYQFDGLLIRETLTMDGVYKYLRGDGIYEEFQETDWFSVSQYGAGGLIVVGGVRNGVNGQWLLFEQDLPFWYLPTEKSQGGGFFYVWGLDVGGGLQVWYDFLGGVSENRSIQVPAGIYLSVSSFQVDIGGTYAWKEGDTVIGITERIPRYSTVVYLAEDVGIVRIGAKEYGLDLVEFVRGSTPGDPVYTAVAAATQELPTTNGLAPNVPNPFNSTTQIPYRLAVPGPVRLEIYNTLGQPVRKLVDQVQAAGWYQVQWDARDQRGAAVAAGVYLTLLYHPDGMQIRRLLYLK